jgi:hypothetical protein
MFELTEYDSFGVCDRRVVSEAPQGEGWRLEAMQPGPFARAVEVWSRMGGGQVALVYPV